MRILVIAPHADDETIGVGGIISRYVAEGHDVFIAVMTGHGEHRPHPLWKRELWDKIRGELRNACKIMGVKEIIFKEIPAVLVHEQPVWEINKISAEIVDIVKPEILFIPFLNDLHRDHREIFRSFEVHWRPFLKRGRDIKKVYSYETMSETHLNFPYVEQGFYPNVYVDISDYLELKLEALKCFRSQIQKHPSARSLEAIKALAVWRGSHIGVHAAEALVLVRELI